MADLDIILTQFNELKEMVKNMPTEKAAMPPEIINTDELCKRLAISEPTAIKWRNKKKIPSFHIGTSIRYNWPKVIESLETKSTIK